MNFHKTAQRYFIVAEDQNEIPINNFNNLSRNHKISTEMKRFIVDISRSSLKDALSTLLDHLSHEHPDFNFTIDSSLISRDNRTITWYYINVASK